MNPPLGIIIHPAAKPRHHSSKRQGRGADRAARPVLPNDPTLMMDWADLVARHPGCFIGSQPLCRWTTPANRWRVSRP